MAKRRAEIWCHDAIEAQAPGSARLIFGTGGYAAGKIRVGWAIDRSSEPNRLHLRWVETGGPPVMRPERRGFGTRLIERGLAQDLQGAVQIDFAPAGVVCTVDAPIA